MISQSASKDWGCISASTWKALQGAYHLSEGQRLQVVDKFTFLGSTLSRVVHIDDEVNARIAKASAAFGRLCGCIWDRSGIRLDTKQKVYRSVVMPTLLYACETWTVYQRHAKRLNHFHTSCLRKLLKIKWQDRIPDTEVLKRAWMQSVHTLLKLAQLRWTGHVTRMPDERLPKKILYWELQVGNNAKNVLLIECTCKTWTVTIGQTVQTQIRHRRTWRLLRVCTVR